MKLDFRKCLNEVILYSKGDENNFAIVSLYVDDMLVAGARRFDDLVKKLEENLQRTFEMIDLAQMAYFLGMEIKQKNNKVFVCHKKYEKKILKKFRTEVYKSTSTPMCQKEKQSKNQEVERVDETFYKSIVGCSMYLTATSLDILHVVSFLDLPIVQLKLISEQPKE